MPVGKMVLFVSFFEIRITLSMEIRRVPTSITAAKLAWKSGASIAQQLYLESELCTAMKS